MSLIKTKNGYYSELAKRSFDALKTQITENLKKL